MVIDFICIDFEEEDIKDISDLKSILKGEWEEESKYKLKPVTMKASLIDQVEPSIYNPE